MLLAKLVPLVQLVQLVLLVLLVQQVQQVILGHQVLVLLAQLELLVPLVL